MSYFKKARRYTEPSVSLDEKIAKANREYEKTGVELSEWSGNKTGGVYYAGIDNPEIPAVQSEVPDTTGWRSGDPSLPAENASDIDPNDSSTWDTGGQGMEDLINPNSLPVDNGDDVSDQPTVATPDLSGFKSLRTDENDPNSSMSKYGGIARTSLLGVWGTTTGVIGNGNKFESVLLAFGWPTGPLVDPHEPGYPSDRSWGGIYRYDDNATYGARLNMRSYMNNLPDGAWKPYKCWMPFNSYGFGQTWTQFSSNPNNIWKHDSDGQTYAYVQVSVYAGPGKYNSSQTVPPSTTVLFHDDIGKPENLPVGGGLKSFLENLFGLAGSAAQGLLDAVGDAKDAVGELFAGEDLSDKEKQEATDISEKSPEEVQSALGQLKDAFNDALDGSIDAFMNWKGFDGKGFTMAEKAAWVADTVSKIGTAGKVYVNYLSGGLEDGSIDNEFLGADYVHDAFKNADINYDGNVVVGDNVIGSGGKPSYDAETGEVTLPFNYDFDTNQEQIIKDPDKYDVNASVLTAAGMVSAWILGGKYGLDSVPVPGAGYATWLAKTFGSAQGTTGHGITMSVDELKKVNPYLLGQLKNKGIVTEQVINESTLLTEKNHLRARREEKRGLVEKKVGNKVMKINIPGPNDHLTVKAIDMLRQYKVSEKEMQEYATIIGQINQWIRDNPKEYAIWKVRYPANDPRLAELNWRLDQQLKASDEYMDSHFPENEKLFGKLKQKIATNVDITDPRNFIDVKPAVTHKQLLKVSKALGEESIKWTPLSTGIANKTTQTFALSRDFFGTEIPELGQDGNEVTANFGGLGGVESQPSQFEYKAQEGNPVTVSPPTYKSLSLAGYAKPLPWKMARKSNVKKAKEINTQLDSSEDFTKKINADALMKARVDKANEIYDELVKKYDADKKAVEAHNESINKQKDALFKKSDALWEKIRTKHYQGQDWSDRAYYAKTDAEMTEEYMKSGGEAIDKEMAALDKKYKDLPTYPDYPDVYNDNYWKDGLDSSTNKVTPSKDPSHWEKKFSSLKAGFWQMGKIAWSMLTNKQVHANPTSKQINEFAKIINHTTLTLIPVSDTPLPYSDSNFKEVDGKLVQHHGNSPDYTEHLGFGDEGSEIGDRGSAMLQIITPKDGEPYILYTDHAYINTNNPDDANAFQDFGAEVVQGVSKSKPTGGMDGVYGDVRTEFSIPVSSLTKAQQEAVFLNHNFRKKKKIDESLFKKLGKKR